ncbi:MAG: mannonate dehydratase [Salinivirgaceae bacterium]
MYNNDNPGFEHTWRWFGPNDRITLEQIRQTGATGIVTALHQVPVGDVWTAEAIQERKALIEKHGMTWSVVESVPVSEAIKKQKGNYMEHIGNYKQTLSNLAQCGIYTVCYNFMPVLDWSRTNLNYTYNDGSQSLKYEYPVFAAFDLFILRRKNAAEDYSQEVIDQATRYFASLNEAQKADLQHTILLGLPGSLEAYTLEAFQAALEEYRHIDKAKLREHLIYFLQEISPVAEHEGIKLAIHPDDPPWAQLGLPRIVTGYDDIKFILTRVNSQANGITLCTGSLGAGYSNDLVKMAKDFAERIHFAHLRNVSRDAGRNFRESNLFEGNVDIVSVAGALIKESMRRKIQQRPDFKIPIRPDHGFQILGDIGLDNYPGYGLYGRMKSLAEIRGMELGLLASLTKE